MTSPESGSREYRVTWRRKDTPRRHRIFMTLVAAERLAANLTERDDLHWKCDEAHIDCFEPIEDGPVIEERTVLPWLALRSPADTGEHQEGDVGS